MPSKKSANPNSDKILKLFDNTVHLVEERVLDLKHSGADVASIEEALLVLRPKRSALQSALKSNDSETINLIITVLKKLALRAKEHKLEAKKVISKPAAANKISKEVAVIKKEFVKEKEEFKKQVAAPKPALDKYAKLLEKLNDKMDHLEKELVEAREERDELRTRVERKAGVDLTQVMSKIAALSSDLEKVESSALPSLKQDLESAVSEMRHSLNKISSAAPPSVGGAEASSLEAAFNKKLSIVVNEIKSEKDALDSTQALISDLQSGLRGIEEKMAQSSQVHSKFGKQIGLLANLGKGLDEKIERGDALDQVEIEQLRDELTSLSEKLSSEEEKRGIEASIAIEGMQGKMANLEESLSKEKVIVDELTSDLNESMTEFTKLRKKLGAAHS